MPLARIISHSHENCRELAVDLLARGYAVEIVSPDRIPDNFADLELRVDTDTANALTANVAAHTGAHSSFLDFVHHLGAPMGDFVRRPPKAKFESIANVTPVSFNDEPNLAPEVEIPTGVQIPAPIALPFIEAPKLERPKIAASPAPTLPMASQIPVVPAAVSDPQADAKDASTVGTEEVPPRPTRQRPRHGITIILHRSRPTPKIRVRTTNEAGGWFLRVATGFALIVALSAIPIVGIRDVDPLVPKVSADAEKIVPQEASQETSASRTTMPETAKVPAEIRNQSKEFSAAPVPSVKQPLRQGATARNQAQTRELASDAPLIYRDKPAVKAHSRHDKVHHQHQDDSIAEDTVTYIDRGYSRRNH